MIFNIRKYIYIISHLFSYFLLYVSINFDIGLILKFMSFKANLYLCILLD